MASPPGWLAYEKAQGENAARSPRRSRGARSAGLDLDRALEPTRRRPGLPRRGTTLLWRQDTDPPGAYLADRGGAQAAEPGPRSTACRPPRSPRRWSAELDGLVAAAVPTLFHGDLHEGNIIAGDGGYRLIDWRDDFGGLDDRGDQLYDLAKLLHTLELPESVMDAGTYRCVAASDGSLTIGQPDTALRADGRRALRSGAPGAGSISVRSA